MVTAVNNLTRITFSAIPDPMPSTWNLSSYLPAGALSVTHLQVRWQPVAGAFGAWGAVASWNPATLTAGFYAAGAAQSVEFRRVTPSTPYLDPALPTSRVSENNLRVNADQGVFVAVELAAASGLNAYSASLPAPLADLGLRQYTQNHWGPGTDFAQKTWAFQFAGGYLARSHVKAKVKLSGVWSALTIGSGSTGNFKFVGDYHLWLDLKTLVGVVEGLVIYRHTPRNVNVTSPLDGARITADGMEPSARHALFVAVEIGEMLASQLPGCDCVVPPPPAPASTQYFTSDVFPLSGTPGFTSAGPAPYFPFEVPWNDAWDPLAHRTLGPEAAADTGMGRNSFTWEVAYTGGAVEFKRAGGAVVESLVVAGVTSVHLAFDDGCDWVLAYHSPAGTTVRWYNGLGEVTIPSTSSCSLTSDDSTTLSSGTGAILFYTRGEELFYRTRISDFSIEYTAAGFGTLGAGGLEGATLMRTGPQIGNGNILVELTYTPP